MLGLGAASESLADLLHCETFHPVLGRKRKFQCALLANQIRVCFFFGSSTVFVGGSGVGGGTAGTPVVQFLLFSCSFREIVAQIIG